MPEERDSIASLKNLIDRLRRISDFSAVGMGAADIIDEAVAKIEKKIAETARQSRQNDLVKIFFAQIETLKNLGVPLIILEALLQNKNRVIDKSCNMTCVAGNLPFIPVIPQTYLSILSQMAMISNEGNKGYTFMKPTAIRDIVETPEDPYYIYDVEVGKATMGLIPQNSETLINRQGRLKLTVTEVIALGIHAGVLSSHCVDAVGSRFEYLSKYYAVPSLQISFGWPKLYHHLFDQAISQFGAASCGSRGD